MLCIMFSHRVLRTHQLLTVVFFHDDQSNRQLVDHIGQFSYYRIDQTGQIGGIG